MIQEALSFVGWWDGTWTQPAYDLAMYEVLFVDSPPPIAQTYVEQYVSMYC
jgi:hypothetical protein